MYVPDVCVSICDFVCVSMGALRSPQSLSPLFFGSLFHLVHVYVCSCATNGEQKKLITKRTTSTSTSTTSTRTGISGPEDADEICEKLLMNIAAVDFLLHHHIRVPETAHTHTGNT